MPPTQTRQAGKRDARRTATAGATDQREVADRLWPSSFLIGIGLLLITRITFWVLQPQATEDAYITFRYARNFLSGQGLVYNVGERVMGFTSPLWVLWTAFGLRLAIDPVVWTRLTAVAADGVTLFAAGALLRRYASPAAAWCFTIFFAAWPFFSAVAVSGMESSSMLAMILLGTWLTTRGSRWCGPTLGALALVRPEGAVCAAILARWTRWSDRAVAAVSLLVGIAVLWAYYGSPVPHSAIAKAAAYGIQGPWERRLWWDWLLPVELGRWPGMEEPLQLWPLRILLAPAAALGFWQLRRSPAFAFVVAALVVWLGYALLGVAYFYWYFLLPVVLVAFLASAGLPEIVRGRWVYTALVLLVAGSWSLQPAKIYAARARAEARLFVPVAHFLADNAAKGQSVLLEPLGFIGWQNPDLLIHDEVGLVTPAVRKRSMEAGWYADLVRQLRPDWLVVRYSLLSTGAAFAETAPPFRDKAEAEQILGSYTPAFATAERPAGTDLVVMRRAP